MRYQLTSSDWAKINALLPPLYRELDPDTHTQVLLRTVGTLVPGDCIALDHFNPVTRETRTDSFPPNFATEEQLVLIHRYNHQSPAAPYFSSVPDPEWKTISDFMPVEDFWQTEFHQLGLAQLNIHHQILALLARIGQAVYVLSVNRSGPMVTERERSLLNAIQPHLATSFLNAQKFAQAQDSLEQLRATMETTPGAYGYFAADRTLAWLQPRAQEWLAQFFADEARYSNNLPKSLVQLIETAADRASHSEHANSTHRLTVCVLPSVLGGWILRLERHPLEPTPHFRPLPQLSARENDVLRWLVEGKRNAEIASILGISPRTVEKHVEVILATLKVENRASAILRTMELCATAHLSKTVLR